MFCAFTRPRYQVSIYRTNGSVDVFIIYLLKMPYTYLPHHMKNNYMKAQGVPQ